jgi:hypothetical protein
MLLKRRWDSEFWSRGRAPVDERYEDLEKVVPLQGMLGYLNFASGKPDARFQKQLNEACGFLAERGAAEPWTIVHELLSVKLKALQEAGTSAFRDTTQAEAVLNLALTKVPPAYRHHHADLLFHLSDRDLFQPFFLARIFEAVLLQGAPWEEEQRIVAGALAHLNDYVGHRPIAILETRPKGEPYEQERVRPIPLFIRGAGVAWGRYHALIGKALEILAATDPGILADAYLDPELLDELALDPRAYDHGHPVNRRPNYVFGEWDPHHLDLQGRYRRYVVRQVTVDALLDRLEHSGDLDTAELLLEAAAVFVGTMLMGTGIRGTSPATHDSTTTLATLVPRIAHYRDVFYAQLLGTMPGAHGSRLRQEATTTRQPFGGARQHLNHYLARHRALQLQQRQLAMLFAEMGYPEAGQKEATRIPATSARLLSEILGRLTTGQLLVDRGERAAAARLLPEVEGLLQRGIACGAFADPWNILGFQGLFPLFTAREDSIRDTRIDELVHSMEHIFNLSSRLTSEAAAVGDKELSASVLADLRRLASWWDRFASVEVSDVRRVHGGETVASAEHVATALSHWHERGKTTADLSFWRDHLEGFQSPKAFALVVDALLRKQDYRAAMGLLMNWLGQAEHVALEDGEYSFHALALRWMLGYTSNQDSGGSDTWPMIKRFFDFLEANAEEYWQVPTLEVGVEQLGMPSQAEEEEESPYESAYEGVTYRDSADDNQEGSVADGGELHQEFDLEREGERLTRRLRFLATVARLWQIAARQGFRGPAAQLRPPAQPDIGPTPDQRETFDSWLHAARDKQRHLLGLLDAIQEHPVPEPLGSYDSLIEYDRRRHLKEQLLYTTINTCLDTALAVGTLEGLLGQAAMGPTAPRPRARRPEWELPAIQLEQALVQGDADQTRRLLPVFLNSFQHEPLLFTALADGGQPRHILRVRMAQTVLRSLATNLPRLGLLRETYHLLKTARVMEHTNTPQRRGVSEFNHLFQSAYQAVVEAFVESEAARSSVLARDQIFVDLLEGVTRPFLMLWVEHSQTLQLSILETIPNEDDWQALRAFVQRYGGDLFHAKFMTLANVRGILHRGVGAYLDYLRDNPDPLHPVRLIEDLENGTARTAAGRVGRAEAERGLACILQALVENYEEYKDYNTTTPQSDYGENLHILLDFLRLKAHYERHVWRLQPLALAHEVLARHNRNDLAVSWQEAFTRLTEDLATQYLEKLANLERTHGVRLRTVADRLQERFVKSLALDRLCALIEPAMREAYQPEAGRSFSRLEKELQPFTTTPTGVGLDVPQWLRRLETEVQRVRAKQTSIAVLAEGFFHIPRKSLTLEELRQQVEEWEKPLPEE